jgi:hypothetical protein
MRLFLRLALLAGIGVLANGLTGCNSSSSNPLGPISGGNAAQVRFVNGSPDAGPVQIFIDNQQQFCANGATGNSCTVSYGQVTTYAVNLNPGSHAITLKDQNGNSITIPSASLAVNGGGKYSIVLTGELHPSYTSAPNLGIITFTDEPFNTPSGGAAVNFHYASPAMAAQNPLPLQFGYFINNNTSTATGLGQTTALGSETTPQGITNTAALNVPITFYAGSPTGPTVTPSQIDSTKCSSNSMPCSTGNLSLYLIDGPAASTSPTAIPSGFSSSAMALFVGTFD